MEQYFILVLFVFRFDNFEFGTVVSKRVICVEWKVSMTSKYLSNNYDCGIIVMKLNILLLHSQVRDLLNPASNKKGGLKVRQHPSKGFYGELYCFN